MNECSVDSDKSMLVHKAQIQPRRELRAFMSHPYSKVRSAHRLVERLSARLNCLEEPFCLEFFSIGAREMFDRGDVVLDSPLDTVQHPVNVFQTIK